MCPSREAEPDDLAEQASRLDAEDLRKLVLQAAERHDDVARAVRLVANRKSDGLTALRTEIDSGLRTRRFLGYWESVAGNQFAPSRFAIPLTIDDPVERMRAIQTLVSQQRGEPALQIMGPISGVPGRLPVSATIALLGSIMRAVDVATSNVPGSPIPIYTAGARVEANYGFGPLAGAACNINLLSYLDEIETLGS